MLRYKILLGTALALSSLHAAASPVRVTFDWPGGAPSSTTRVHVRAVRLAGYSNKDAPIEADGQPDGLSLNLGPGVWQLQASASGYWSHESEVAVSSQSPAIRLALWPAATLRGTITSADAETLPATVQVSLTTAPPSSPTPQSTPAPSRAELHCPIANGAWVCIAPAGLFDMRLEAAGYAARYEWGTSLKAGETLDLGRTELRQTASVFGRAIRKDGSAPPAPCRAILEPDLSRRGVGDADAKNAASDDKTFSVPLTSRGYFQVVGLQPGRHTLDIKCHEASAFREVVVQARGETRIDSPIQLEELALDIVLSPKVDPRGLPWQLTIDETSPSYRRITNKALASADGRWARRGLRSGNYRVTVTSSDGTLWLQRYLNLRADTPLSLHLASVRVAGRVSLSMQPVRARLIFSNNGGSESATLTSDDNGRFQGLLPVRPGVQETSWTVDAHVTQPPVKQRLLGINVHPAAEGTRAWLDLDLPMIAVRGSVVSPDGQPQGGAEVSFQDSTGTRTTTSTGDAGNFEMADLPAGMYTAVADSPQGTSDPMSVQVFDHQESELKLVLNPFRHAAFYVVSANGPVANAAVQVWIAPGVPQAFARTDQDGRFEVPLPSGVTELGLTVGAPGYALKMTRLTLPTDNQDGLPSDANTIRLDQANSTLVLNFQPPGRTLDPSATLYLVHGRTLQDARTVAGWGADQVAGSLDAPTVVDAVDPGDYALCTVSDPNQLTALWSGKLPSDTCQKGSIDEGGKLTLAPR